MIDAFIVEALAATGSIGLGLAFRRRMSRAKRAPAVPPIGRWIAHLPKRQRREARAIVILAREHVDRHGNDSGDAFTARETLRSYLPETIAAYLSVPPALRKMSRVGGRSPADELGRQLTTLRGGLERLRDTDGDVGAARMAENGAFLHERFGPPPLPPAEASAFPTLGQVVDTLIAYLPASLSGRQVGHKKHRDR